MTFRYPFLTVREVAQKLKVHESYIRKNWARWHVEYKLPVIRLGSGPKGSIRFREADVDQMVKEHMAV